MLARALTPSRPCRAIRSYTTSGQSKSSPSKLRWAAAGTVGVAGSYWLWTASSDNRSNLPLSPTRFSPTTLASSKKTSPTTKLIKLALPPSVASSLQDPSLGSIWSIYVKDSDIQVERPYTPLEGLSENGILSFWVRKYEHGEVGRWMHSRDIGDTIEIRGPETTWAWKEGEYDDIVMLAGGTGIAPFYQLLQNYFVKTSGKKERFTLIQGHRSTSELPPSLVIDQLRAWERSFPDQLSLVTLLDSIEGATKDQGLTRGRISESLVREVLKGCHGRTMVLVCGPDQMLHALAGPKARDQSQGPLGGVLARLKTDSIDVWKL